MKNKVTTTTTATTTFLKKGHSFVILETFRGHVPPVPPGSYISAGMLSYVQTNKDEDDSTMLKTAIITKSSASINTIIIISLLLIIIINTLFTMLA